MISAALVLEATDDALDSTVNWGVALVTVAAADTIDSTAPRVVA